MKRDIASTALMQMSAAAQALAECQTAPAAREIANRAAAILEYCKQARLGREMQNEVAVVKLRAERRTGELLADLDRKGGAGRGHKKISNDGDLLSPYASALAEAKATWQDAQRWQDLARVPNDQFERWLNEMKAEVREITTASALRELASGQRRNDRLARIDRAARPLGEVGKFPILLGDPPWQYDAGSTDPTRRIENHYPTMTLEAICALPVHEVCTDDALLYLWATAPKLEEALEVMRAWGFRYRSNIVWDKQRTGMGYWSRVRHEHLLIGVKGDFPPPAPEHRVDSVFDVPHPVGRHSEKPHWVRDMIERAYEDLPKLELFARGKPAPGWSVWGNEADTGSEAVDVS